MLDNFDPTYGYRKDIFVINDVDLIVPPTNIDIQTEDLVWQWRGLRQKTTTKIPSGQGQNSIQVKIPFTGSMLLDMHRLIVQFRHSPFCYIENRFIRETIVPHWPLNQSMAFTMTGLAIAPMAGSSDTWIMQLDLVWFNYAPYLHNWLYRKDWHTIPMSGDTDLSNGVPIEATIGWTWEEGVKRAIHSILPSLMITDGKHVQGVRTWDAVQAKYTNKDYLSIQEMEERHRGEIFDLMPLPNKMAKAEFVVRPAHSRIYVRYINLLQRDALLKNFDIDIEKMMSPLLKECFFNAVRIDQERYVFGLHNGPAIESLELQREWQRIKSDIIKEMTSLNGGVLFDFFSYQEVRLPAAWNKAISKAHKHSIDNAINKVRDTIGANGLEASSWIYQEGYNGEFGGKVKVRKGFSDPKGHDGQYRVSPVGKKGSSSPMNIGELRVTDVPKWRSASTLSRIYGSSFSKGRMHWGTDIGGEEGSPVFAIEQGVIEQAITTSGSIGSGWKQIDATDPKTNKIGSISDYSDFEASMKAIDPNIKLSSNKIQGSKAKAYPVGSFVKSLKYRAVWYFAEGNAAGNRVVISHGQNKSMYYHLSGIADGITPGKAVEAGTLIGWLGRSGTISNQYIKDKVKSAPAQGLWITRGLENYYTRPDGEQSSVWHLKAHLHFEYWETQSAGAFRDTDKGDESVEEVFHSSRMVPVDLNAAILISEPDRKEFVYREDLTAPTEDTVLQEVGRYGLSEEDIGSVTDILRNLWDDGWLYYDRDASITNLWWKPFHLLINKANLEYLTEGFVDDTLVLTHVAGGFRHVVANIPILGHEFPTQQHLGSIEPFYSFEFASIDKEGKGIQDSAGISAKTETLLGMKTMLHSNARNFRTVVDSWCLSGDSFITRILGTFRPEDKIIASYDENENFVISDIDIKRRLMISRSNSSTVPGHPGLSSHHLEFQETNPYEAESINSTGADLGDVEDAIKQVLNAVYRLDFNSENSSMIRKALVAHLSGKTWSLEEDEDFGKFEIDYTTDGRVYGNVAIYKDSFDKEWLYIAKSSDSNLAAGFGDLAAQYGSPPNFPDVTAIPLEEIFSEDEILEAVKEKDDAWYSNKLGPSYRRYRKFDIGALLRSSQEGLLIGQIPMGVILDYHTIISTTVNTAELMLAEDSSQISSGVVEPGGISLSTVSNELYGLPIVPSLFKGLEHYMANVAVINPLSLGLSLVSDVKPGDAVNHLISNPNWLVFSGAKASTNYMRQASSASFAEYDEVGKSLWKANMVPIDVLLSGGWSLAKKVIFPNNNSKGILTNLIMEAHDDALNRIANRYVELLPMRELILERFKSYVTASMLGDMLGGIVNSEKSPVFQNTTNMIKKTVASCGNFSIGALGFPTYIIYEDWNKGVVEESDTLRDSGSPEIPVYLPDGTIAKFFLNELKGVQRPNSPFVWYVDAALEKQKLEYFKKLLAKYGQDMLNNYDLLKAFGLEGLSRGLAQGKMRGGAALPDLDLPHHPYYGTTTACPPDFYMWNMYEDGDAHNQEIVAAVEEAIGDVIENAYNSLKKVTAGTNYLPSKDPNIQEPELDSRLSLPTRYNAEATDDGVKGPVAFPFYPNPNSSEAIAQHMGTLQKGAQETASEADSAAIEGQQRNRYAISSEDIAELESVVYKDVRLSITEGPLGLAGGVHYPRRADASEYNQLEAELNSLTHMFGSRAGYLNRQSIEKDLTQRLDNPLLAEDPNPTHRFDKEGLNDLAKHSAADLFSQKRRLARAYPTFKLFFVEEDEFENRLLNFDDFYSYNSVVSFTVEESRKSPAGHAVITLLNVAGTLDGTKRDAVADLDFFGEEKRIKVPGEASKLSGDDTVQNSIQDQPFGSVILRPGLNVQLRCGYSNDPDLLEVLINGRIVDVTWNQGGDRTEIMVQSFGTELQQALKGTSGIDEGRSFATTHQLLGAMMLEPELVHFGRWEFGKLYQVGEGKDARLDFKDYSRESFLGHFRAPNAIRTWLLDNPMIVGVGLIAGGVLFAIPGVGRLLTGRASRGIGAAARGLGRVAGNPGRTAKVAGWVGDWLSAISLASPGAAYYRKLAVKVVGKTGGGPVTVATKAAIQMNDLIPPSRWATMLQYANSFGTTSGAYLRSEIMKSTSRVASLAGTGAATIDDIATAAAKADREILIAFTKAMWMKDPTQVIQWSWSGLISAGGNILPQAGKRVVSAVWNYPVAVAGLSIAAMPLAALDAILSKTYDATLKRIKAYFRTKQVSLFLSPQDDNLFPPHPKDYMEFNLKGFDGVWQQLVRWSVTVATTAVFADNWANPLSRWFLSEDVFDKRVPPEACRYKLQSQTIWDVFHDMSLRHPGWIYAVRPYGNEFRYTMFFGVPSQRYWALPGDNEFVRRANKLHRIVNDKEVTVSEFRELYGDIYDDGEASYTLEEIDQRLEEEAIKSVSKSDLAETDLGQVDKVASSLRKLTYTAKALEEYISALNLRFKPFRRYHSFTSDNDIVWNGLISSEAASYNAVDVTYYEDSDTTDAPVASLMIKAHAHIPEHQLRVLPLEENINCRGFIMAGRYGQGALLHTLRDMYRGEIVLLGNPRIKPWDIGILSDSYNDMVGPIEIEQVIHQFSHETGYITEIKPSAVVMANETSSWPILEAMKVASLAVKDIDEQYLGLNATDPTLKFQALSWLLGFGAGASKEYSEYLKERAAAISPLDPFTDPKEFTSDIKTLREVEEAVGDEVRKGLAFVGAGLAVGGGALLLKGSALARVGSAAQRAGSAVKSSKIASGLALGGVGIAGANSAVWLGNKLTPSISWLLGSPILFLHCLRGDSIMLVPLMKNGHPIVSGLNLSDPAMIWKNFKGDLGRWVDDAVQGTNDLAEIWRLYGMHSWRRLDYISSSIENEALYDMDRTLKAELTGGER